MNSVHLGILTALRWLLLDSVTALWVTVLALLVLVWLPSLSLPPSHNSGSDRAIAPDRPIEALALSILFLVTGVLMLSALSLFNWFTLALWYSSGLLALRLSNRHQHTLDQIPQLGKEILYFGFDLLDQQASWKSLRESVRQPVWARWQAIAQAWQPQQLMQSDRLPALIAFTVILSFTLLLRYQHPLMELRFSSPDSYGLLLATRQILIGDALEVTTPGVFSSLAAVLSLFGSMDPMQVHRFLSPLLGVGLVLAAGYSIYSLMADGAAAFVTLFSLGAYWFSCPWAAPADLPIWLHQSLDTLINHLNASLVRQWTGSDPELGALFLILVIVQMDRAFNRQALSWFGVGCSSAIVAVTAPALLLVAILGGAGLWVGRSWTMGIVAIAWVFLAFVATLPVDVPGLQTALVTLPVGLSLLCGVGFAWLMGGIGRVSGVRAQTTCLLLVFALSVNFILPPALNLVYLEYDIAARETLVLNSRFSAKRWMVVAPIEQLSQTLGDGWYGDLIEFVERYGHSVDRPNFKFPLAVPDLFVFVEKRPFKTFQVEPSVISADTGFDPVYMNYRSLAGRSSLEFKALELCETYRQTHPNTSIEYEDDTLRVYHFQLPEQVPAK